MVFSSSKLGGWVWLVASAAVASAATLKEGDVCTISGSGSSGFSDGAITAASFDLPTGISLMNQAASGQKLLVADRSNHAIRGIAVDDGTVETLAGSGSSGYADGTGTNAKFRSPGDVDIDGKDERAYIADTQNHVIRGLTIATKQVFLVAGDSQGDSLGTASSARFDTPEGIVVSFDGNTAYVTDGRNHKVKKINLNTNEVTALAGSGSSGSMDGAGTNATFNHPRGITLSHDESALYVADTGNSLVRKIVVSSGEVTKIASTHDFSEPYDIVTDDDGSNLYVSESSGHEIKKIVIATEAVSSLAGDGSGSMDGNGNSALFDGPRGLAVIDDDRLLVADSGNNNFRIVQNKDDDDKDYSLLCGFPLDVPNKTAPTPINSPGSTPGSGASIPTSGMAFTVAFASIALVVQSMA